MPLSAGSWAGPGRGLKASRRPSSNASPGHAHAACEGASARQRGVGWGEYPIVAAPHVTEMHPALPEIRAALILYPSRRWIRSLPPQRSWPIGRHAWQVWHGSRAAHRTRIAVLLPSLLEDLRHAARAYDGKGAAAGTGVARRNVPPSAALLELPACPSPRPSRRGPCHERERFSVVTGSCSGMVT